MRLPSRVRDVVGRVGPRLREALRRYPRVEHGVHALAGRVRRGWRKALRITAIIALAGPFVLVLPLNVIQPPTTSIMIQRALGRLVDGRRPWYPRRQVVSRDRIAPALRRAVLAAEDDRFYLHRGFDFTELREALAEARRGRRLRGASTITQQTAKNLFLWEGRSLVRKGAEAYFTLVLELCLSKERILDLYLNLAEWGDGVFGAEAAARLHYGKAASALTRAEAAALAAILPAPRRWRPDGAVAERRVGAILERMEYEALRRGERPRRPQRLNQ